MFFVTRGLRLFLAALLIFSQQQAVLHLLGHDLAQLSQKDATDPQDAVCAKCLAIAHFDHAVSGDVPTFTLPPHAPEPIAQADSPGIDLAFVARYRSRAPPVFS
jgi:hypothetical protein